MTWLEFKTEVERQGVTDDMEIDYIDITRPYNIAAIISKVPVRDEFGYLTCYDIDFKVI